MEEGALYLSSVGAIDEFPVNVKACREGCLASEGRGVPFVGESSDHVVGKDNECVRSGMSVLYTLVRSCGVPSWLWLYPKSPAPRHNQYSQLFPIRSKTTIVSLLKDADSHLNLTYKSS